MSKRSSPTLNNLTVELQPSRQFGLLLLGFHCLALVAIWSADIGVATSLLLSAATFMHGYWRFRSDALLLGRGSVTRLRYHAGRWWIKDCGGERAVSLVRSRVWRWLTVLYFSESKVWRSHRSVVLMPDSADPELQRQLRVMLRHYPVYQKDPDTSTVS